MPTLIVQIIWFMLNTCLPSGSLGFQYIKRLGAEPLRASLVDNPSQALSQPLPACEGPFSVTAGRGPSEACAWFPPDFAPRAFSLC